jgi:plastocyanin
MRVTRRAAIGGLLLLALSRPGLAAEAAVTIDNFSFTPAEITVPVGTKITWTNRDDIPHTVVDAANPKTIKSAPLDTDESYSRVFDKPGRYEYFCSLHPHMHGIVVVK